MDLKDLQEFLQDEKNAEAFSGIVSAMGYKPENDYKTLEADRDAERKRKREYQQKLDEMQKRLDEIENKYYIDGEGDEPVKKGDPVKNLERQLQKLQQEYQKEQTARQQIQSKLVEKSRQEQLLKALQKADIDQSHYNLLVSAFAGKAVIDETDDTFYVDDKPLEEYFTAWAQTDGAIYKRQPENRGAGAPGFVGKGGNKTTFTREEMQSPEGRKAYLEAAKKGDAKITN